MKAIEASPGPATLRDLVQRFSADGRIEAIVLRPMRGQPAQPVHEAMAEPGRGLLGDRRAGTPRSDPAARKRELTLIQAEHLPLLAQWCGQATLDPARLRRNLVVSGLNLLALRSPFAGLRLTWQVGESATLEVTGPCDPCSRMERELGVGGYNAMRGHGGVTARLVTGGLIRVGDRVRLAAVQAGPASG
jgi:MOSC domain-containing protein YiiM